MKKIMILQGDVNLVPLIEASKKEGYFVIVCDRVPSHPGVKMADKYYQVNILDRDLILDIAKKEKIDGIISNYDFCMQVVAYVAEQLGLQGTSLESVKKLNEKAEFRKLQHEVGAFAPEYVLTSSFEEACTMSKRLKFPIVIKPNRSSGSRGTTVVDTYDGLIKSEEAWKTCADYSVDSLVVLEEYVEMDRLDGYVEGDIFVLGNRIFWDGIDTCTRSPHLKKVAMTDVFPIVADETELEQIKNEIKALVLGAGITFGEYNIEMYCSPEGKMFMIEINARQGGFEGPLMIQKHTGVDMYKMLVTTAMGDASYFDSVYRMELSKKYICRQPVLPHHGGVFHSMVISDEVKEYVTECHQLKDFGYCIDENKLWAGDVLAYVDLEFPTRELQLKFVREIEQHIYAVIDQKGK